MMRSHSLIATPPGATIREQLVDKRMKQKEFAARMGLSEKHVSKLINGEVALTPDVAMRLEMVLGIPAQFWSKLESIYRDKLVRIKAENEMNAEIELAKNFPYNEMVRNRWIDQAKDSKEKVIFLRKYFEVARLELLQKKLLPSIACRRLATTEKANIALISWAQQAKLKARQIQTSSVDLKKLQSKIPEIRAMTLMDPEYFCSHLPNILADCGIALVFLPHLQGSFLHAATFYDMDKIIIGLTVRGKDADKFWFSLFHELGHIIYGHIDKQGGTSDSDENQADAYAQNTLIPQQDFDRYVLNGIFTRETIISFAHEIGIDTGIVVGRLQREKYIQYNQYNELKKKYEIKIV